MLRQNLSRILSLAVLCATLPACGGKSAPRPQPSTYPSQTSQPSGPSGIPSSAPPSVSAESAIVIDAVTGKVLYAKNADSLRPVASTQKLVTALVLIDAGPLDKPVQITMEDTLCEPTKLFMKPGEVYNRRDLLRVLMVKSANDVARALARDCGGSLDGFAALMNRKAAGLGMRNSHFVNPNGLPVAGQYSTARDMAIAARAAWHSPTIRSFTALKSTTFTYNDGHVKEMDNTNRLLKKIPYCDGLKTGTTDAAGRCLISSGTLNGRSTIVVVLKDSTPHIWDDSENLLRWSLESPQMP